MNVQELMSRISESLSVGRSFGTAYEQDGTLVIPVAFVAGGGGGGEGISSPSGPKDHDETEAHDAQRGAPESGSGGGFGGVVVPVGVYVVKDEQVRWVPAVNANLVILAALVVIRMLMRARRRARRRRA